MMQSKKNKPKVTILYSIPAVRAASFIHRINEATILTGSTVSSSWTAAWVAKMVRVTQIFPSFATAFQVGGCFIEQSDELVINIVPFFCGHFADHDLQ
jgi:hypothetical protein